MSEARTVDNPVLKTMVEGLVTALGEGLASVVLYGSAARGDYQKATSDFNLLVVLADLEPGTLAQLRPVFATWRRKKQRPPRLFSVETLRDSADVFPVEFLDIKEAHRVLHGSDPFADLVVHPDHLRLQCERELREKMMRLREGYIEVHDNREGMRLLLAGSYSTFVALFRGCLHLLGGSAPMHNDEVVAAFCARAGIEKAPFDAIAALKRGGKIDGDPGVVFTRYYQALGQAVHAVDRFQTQGGGANR